MGSRKPTVLLMVFLLLGTPLSGCFGDAEESNKSLQAILQIDFGNPSDSILRTGEWHQFTLEGKGHSLSAPDDVLLFVNGSVIPEGIVAVTDEKLTGRLLLTPYVTEVNLTVFYPDGSSEMVEMEVQNGTPIVSGEEWFQ